MTKKLETILRWGVYACALIPLVIFKDFLAPFHFGKVVVFRTLIEIMSVLYLALILRDRRYLPKTNALFWVLTSFMLIFGITSLTSINAYQSIMGTLERMGGWFTFLHFWFFYVIAISVLRTKNDWIRLVRISVFASFISVMYGFFQKAHWDFIIGGGGRARIFGTLGNTALFAGYTIVNLFLAVLLLWQKPSDQNKSYLQDLLLLVPFVILASITSGPFKGWPLLLMATAGVLLIGFGIIRLIGTMFGKTIGFFSASYGVIALLNLIAIIMTAVRGSLFALLASIPLFALLYIISGTSRRLKVGLGAVALILIIGQTILVVGHDSKFVSSHPLLSRMSDVSTKTKLAQTRFWAWQAGIDGWNDSAKSVIFGWGPENFNVPFSVHFNPKFYQGPGSETLFDRAHNMFVEVLVTMGLLGFAMYIAMFVVLFRMFWKMYRRPLTPDHRFYAITFASGLVAYMIHNAFIFDTSANYIAFFIFAAFASHLLQPTESISDAKHIPKPSPATLRYSVVLLASIFAIIVIYRTDLKPVKANYATTRAIVASWNNDHATAVAKFQQAMAYDTFPVYEIRHRYAQYVLESYGKFKKEQGLNAGDILLQVAEEVKKNESYKMDYLPYLYISRVYITLGKADKASPFNDLALQNSLKALEISPTFVRTYSEVAQAYLNKKDYNNAVATFKKAVDLNPDVGLSWWYLGLTQVEGGDVAGGLRSLGEAKTRGYAPGENDLLRLITLYSKMGDFTMTAKLYEELIVMNPRNPQYHASLATAYAQIRKIDDAVREARLSASIDPSFEADAKMFVQSLGRAW